MNETSLTIYHRAIEKIITATELGLNTETRALLSDQLKELRGWMIDCTTDYLMSVAELEILTALGREEDFEYIKLTARKLLDQHQENTDDKSLIAEASVFYCLSVIHDRDSHPIAQCERFLRLALDRHQSHWNALVRLSLLGDDELYQSTKAPLLIAVENAAHPATRRYLAAQAAHNFYCARDYIKALEYWSQAEAIAPLIDIYHLDNMAECLVRFGRNGDAMVRLNAAYHQRKRANYSMEMLHYSIDHPLVGEIAAEAAHSFDQNSQCDENLFYFTAAVQFVAADTEGIIIDLLEDIINERCPSYADVQVQQAAAIARLNRRLKQKVNKDNRAEQLPFIYEDPMQFKLSGDKVWRKSNRAGSVHLDQFPV